MIVYNDILKKLSDHGWSTYRIRKEKLLPGSVVDRIREGGSITTTTINTLCKICECQPGDLLTYIPDAEEKEGE